MPKFVQLVTFESTGGKFDERKDTNRINEFLEVLQTNGAIIISVTPSLGGQAAKTSAVYVITYEAPSPISL
ncbi:MAG: hypothetical protein HYY41_06000 [Chloroflexi bacterium]|nr:hypothetical protein [Chloroflexota bacterium]MBI2980357.1 hypothetical protein [Chloroflexota bacterium]